ncbi:hypothetical protein D9M69_669880 [compost metagenome]
MTVETETPKEYRVDLEKLQNFFDEKNANKGCPMCGENNWTVRTGGGKIIGVTLPFSDGGSDLYMHGLPKLALSCKNCGFMRLLDLHFCKDALVEVESEENGRA